MPNTVTKNIEPKSNLYSVARTKKKLAKITTPQTRYKRKYIYVKSELSKLAVDNRKIKLK